MEKAAKIEVEIEGEKVKLLKRILKIMKFFIEIFSFEYTAKELKLFVMDKFAICLIEVKLPASFFSSFQSNSTEKTNFLHFSLIKLNNLLKHSRGKNDKILFRANDLSLFVSIFNSSFLFI